MRSFAFADATFQLPTQSRSIVTLLAFVVAALASLGVPPQQGHAQPSNRKPTASKDTFSTNEETVLSVAAPGVLINDSDPDGDSLVVGLLTPPTHGVLGLNPDGSFTYAPDVDFFGSDTFSYFAEDGFGGRDTALVTLLVSNINDAPVAADDSLITDEDSGYVLQRPGLLANDVDADADELRASLSRLPSHGTLSLAPDGGLTYTPHADFFGSDLAGYTITDTAGAADSALIHITVNPVNDPPLAANDLLATDEDSRLVLVSPGVLANDSDAEGSSLTPSVIVAPAHGSLTLAPDGALTYTPDADFFGSDAAAYRIVDNQGAADSAWINITVRPRNDAPIAFDDSCHVAEDSPLSLASPGVLANDVDVDGDILTAYPLSAPKRGSMTLSPDGTLIYTPHASFHGTDSASYRIVDAAGVADTALIHFVVEPRNDPPIVTSETYDLGEAARLVVAAPGVLENDLDIEGDTLRAFLQIGPLHGSLSFASDGSFTYAPHPDFMGADTFTYRVEDGNGGATTGTVTVTVKWLPVIFSAIGDAPYGADEIPVFREVVDEHSLYSPSDFIVHVGDILQGEPCDEARYALVAEVLETSPVPAFIIPGDNETKDCDDPDLAWDYWTTHLLGLDQRFCPFTSVERQRQQPENFAFLYRGMLFIGINLLGGSNPEEVLVNDATWIAQQFEAAGPRVRGAVIFAQDIAEDDDFLASFEAAADSFSKPILYLHGDGHSWIYDHPFANPKILRVQIDRGNVAPVQVTATLDPNEMFVFERDPFDGASPAVRPPCLIPQLNAEFVPVLEGDFGSQSTALSVTLSAPHDQTVTVNYRTIDGTATAGSDYVATSGSLVFPPGTTHRAILFTIKGDQTFEPDESLVFEFSSVTNAWPQSFQTTCTILNDDPEIFTLTTAPLGPGQVVVNPPGGTHLAGTILTLTALPDSGLSFIGWSGDLRSFANPVFVSLDSNMTIHGNFDYNEEPVAQDDEYSTNEDSPFSVTAPGVLANDVDPDGDSLSATVSTMPAHGSILLHADGSFSYAPAADFFGTDSLTYTLSDGRAGFAIGTVRIEVKPLPDVPVALDDSFTVQQRGILFPSAPGIHANDLDVDRVGLTPILVSPPLHGNLTLNFDGSFSYYAGDYVGTDHFVYRASNRTFESNDATVHLNVSLVNAGSMQFLPIADAQVKSTSGNRNYGSDKIIRLENDGAIYNGYLKFNVTGISFVQSARLRLFVVDPGPEGGTVYRVSNNFKETSTAWTEGEITWNNAPPLGDEPLDALGEVSMGTWVELDVRQAFDGDGIYSFGLKNDHSSSVQYSSREGANPPQLALIYGSFAEPNTLPIAVDDVYAIDEDGVLVSPPNGVLVNDIDAGGDTLIVTLLTPPVHGLLDLSAVGLFTYTPEPEWCGVDSFTYVLTDDRDRSDTATASITVIEINDAPVAGSDRYDTLEDHPLVVTTDGLLSNDTDVDNEDLRVTVASEPSTGSLSLNPDGTFTYTPAQDFFGTDTFSYRVMDGRGGVDVGLVSIEVQPVNDPPVVGNDSYSLTEDAALTIVQPGVLENDSDVDGDSLWAHLETAPRYGTLTMAADGSFQYLPAANFFGTDSFTYRLEDGHPHPQIGEVNLTVQPINDAPLAQADVFNATEDSLLAVAAPGVLRNDRDVERDALRTRLVEDVRSGSLDLSTDGSFTYRPSADFYGLDSFKYVVDDGQGGSDTTGAFIVVNPVNDAPVGTEDIYSIAEDETLRVLPPGVLGNDTDIENDPLNVALSDPPLHGSLSLASDGSFSYVPAADYSGPDQFTYWLMDRHGASTLGTAILAVFAQEDPPTAVDDRYRTDESTVLAVADPGVLRNDVNPDHVPLSASLLEQTAHGTVELNSDGSFTFTPLQDFRGTDTFSYLVRGSSALADTGNVIIEVESSNDPPLVADDWYATAQDGQLWQEAPGVLANDLETEGQEMTVLLASGPTSGHLILNPDGSFSYTPNGSFAGLDSFTYRATDGSLESEEATVSIFVALTNQKLDSVQPIADASVKSSTPTTNLGDLDNLVLDNDSREYRSYLKFDLTAFNLVESARLRLYADNGSNEGGRIFRVSNNFADSSTPWTESGITWDNAPPISTPAIDSLGSVSYGSWVEFDVTSAIQARAVVSFALTTSSGDKVEYSSREGRHPPELVIASSNMQPVAKPDTYLLNEDEILQTGTDGIFANDVNADGDPLTARLVSAPVHGNLDLRPDGSFDYRPDANWSGRDSFTYAVEDGRGGSSTAGVTFIVVPVNDRPVAEGETYSTNENLRLWIDEPGVLSNDFDVDGDHLSLHVIQPPSQGLLDLHPDGSFTYRPKRESSGPDSFVYAVEDGHGGLDSATVEIMVHPRARRSKLVHELFDITGHEAWSVPAPGVLNNDFGLAGKTLIAFVESEPGHGILEFDPNGSFKYFPEPGYAGIDSFTYRVEDEAGAQAFGAVLFSIQSSGDELSGDADRYLTTCSKTLVVVSPGVLANDRGVERSDVTAILAESTKAGQLDLKADGAFHYSPDPGFAGTDSFTYRLTDGKKQSAPIRVSIVVNRITTTTTTLVPTADTFVREAEPDANFGSAPYLEVGADEHATNSFFSFELTGMDSIQRAVLRLYPLCDARDGGSLIALPDPGSQLDPGWDEAQMTWNTAPDLAGRPLGSLGSLQVGAWVEIDVTPFSSNVGHLRFALTSPSEEAIRFCSKDGSHPPELVVTWHPSRVIFKQQPASEPLGPLYRSYPNPFSTSTLFEYEVPVRSSVRLAVYNVRGQLVRHLVTTTQASGRQQIRWDGRNDEGDWLGSGVYFLRLQIGEQRQTYKLLLRR